MVVGRFESFDIGDGQGADLYLLRYGADGGLLSPRTEQLLRDSLAGVTDVFVFSHGWNNTFDAAARNYRQFIEGYIAQRAQFGLPMPPNYQPVLVGGDLAVHELSAPVGGWAADRRRFPGRVSAHRGDAPACLGQSRARCGR